MFLSSHLVLGLDLKVSVAGKSDQHHQTHYVRLCGRKGITFSVKLLISVSFQTKCFKMPKMI